MFDHQRYIYKSYFIGGMNKILVLTLFILAVSCGRPPAPVCRPSPLPSVIPVSIGETVRIDLENLFDGYNLVFDGAQKDHISITPKYLVNRSTFEHSFNFTTAKIKDHNRFLGLTAFNDYTELAIGTNHPESGIVIEKVVQVENIPELHCFDVDEIVERTSRKAYAIIDCGSYRMGELHRNEFLFVDLTNYKLILGSRTNDVFVRYNHLIKRRIEAITNPFNNIQYLFRFYTTEAVDQAHADQTYVEIFMNSDNIMKIQILDVIDHTLLGLPSLAIYDFQVHMNYIYLLVKDAGLYQLELTPTQRLIRRSFFPIKMNVNRFVVEQNGFNDDLHLVFSNDNTIYQFVWDVTGPPVLVTKYAIMANSVVDDLLVDENFVIAQVWETVNGEKERRTWVFSRRTLSYTNAFGSFKEPSYGPSIMIYQPMDRTLHLIHEYQSLNIKLNLPYMTNNPASSQKAGDTEEYLIKATSSTGENGTSIECRQTLKFQYIENTDTSIIKTGLQGRNQTYVDAPDDAEFNLQYEFFGRNLSYNVVTTNIDNKTNSTSVPEAYVEKYVKATFNFPTDIDQKSIVYYEMFLENSLEEVDDRNQIYGLVQVQETANSFPIYYILCQVQTDAEFVNPVLKCRTINKSNLSLGKIVSMSQMYSPKQRMAAIVFASSEESVYLYQFEPTGFHYYGHKKFNFNFYNKMTGVEVTMKGQLIVTFQYAKRLQVYKVQDIKQEQQKPAVPLMIIDSRVMSFFGVDYFSPIKTKISIYHDEVTFLQTKTGVMALNINEMGFPELLFYIRTPTSKFDFEVNRDTLVIITETYMAMYRLTTPLRRRQQPFLLQKYNSDFNLNEYDEINSDGLFYLVEKEDTMLLVIHPNMPSTSVIYTEFYIKNIKMIDAVKVRNNEVLFVFNGTNMLAWMFAEFPRLRIRWQPNQSNFTMNVTAFNEKAKSEPYSTLFSIIESNQADIKPTPKFNATAIRRSGHVAAKRNNKKIVDLNITLNDTEWFTGNVLYYNAKCQHCHTNATDRQFQISLQNHLKQLNTEIKVGEPVYDMHSTFTGIYGQMYDSVFKTFPQNDSVQYIIKIPTASRGQVCTKLAVNPYQDYFLSFCETGSQVNVYITTTAASKPTTSGPFPTEANAVNHVEIVNNILMIVDNDDDPFNRAGGVYLYYLNVTTKNPLDVLTMLDFIDNQDLQIEGFRGIPFIASADFHKPLFNRDEYALFITEARTGNIFVFLFELSANKQEAVYLQKRMLELNRLIPQSVKHPTPLRVININIVDYTVRTQPKMKIEYVLLLTVRNWHHIELMFIFDEDYDLLSFEVARLYQRVPYPWELVNFIRLRKGSINASYFAVSYRNYNEGHQLVVVYELPYFSLPASTRLPNAGIPVTKMLAGHRILDTAEMCYDFNTKNEHRILFNDVSTPHLSQLQLNRQLKLVIKNADPTQMVGQNITIIAQNHYTNLSFMVEFKFNFDNDDDDDGDKGTKTQIIWIIILVIGFVVIVGLIFAWSRQNKSSPNRDSAAIKESLLTVEPEFKTNYINRSSVDPESVRGTVDYTTHEPNKAIQREEEASEEKDKSPESQELKSKEEKSKVQN